MKLSALQDEKFAGADEKGRNEKGYVGGHLNGGRGIVNAVLLEEGELAVLVEEERALNAGEGIGGAGHELGVNELCWNSVS